jgi:hypothetical protein
MSACPNDTYGFSCHWGLPARRQKTVARRRRQSRDRVWRRRPGRRCGRVAETTEWRRPRRIGIPIGVNAERVEEVEVSCDAAVTRSSASRSGEV